MANSIVRPRRNSAGEVARERLLEAGERLFSVRELHQVSIDEISTEAGVAHGLLFHYFRSKNAFYAEIAGRAMGRMDDILAEPRREKTADGKLAALLQRHMQFMATRPAAVKFHARGGASAEVKRILEESRLRFIRTVLVRHYQISEPSDTLIWAVRAWLGLFDELVLAWLENPQINREGVIKLAVELFGEVVARVSLIE